MSSYAPLGYDPRVRRLLGWRSLTAPSEGPSSMSVRSPSGDWRSVSTNPGDSVGFAVPRDEGPSPDEMHREQQARAGARVPSTAATSPRLPGWGGVAQDLSGLLGAGAEAIGGVEIGHRGAARSRIADLFPSMPVTHADDGLPPIARAATAAAAAPSRLPGPAGWSPEERSTYEEFVKSRPPSAGIPGMAGATRSAAPAFRASGALPSAASRGTLDWSWGRDVEIDPETGRPASDSMLTAPMSAGTQVQGRESRGGGGFYMPKLEDVAYMPESAIEEAANRRQLAELNAPPGTLTPEQQRQIAFDTARTRGTEGAKTGIAEAAQQRRAEQYAAISDQEQASLDDLQTNPRHLSADPITRRKKEDEVRQHFAAQREALDRAFGRINISQRADAGMGYGG
jgi:hypothetical protein